MSRLYEVAFDNSPRGVEQRPSGGDTYLILEAIDRALAAWEVK